MGNWYRDHIAVANVSVGAFQDIILDLRKQDILNRRDSYTSKQRPKIPEKLVMIAPIRVLIFLNNITQYKNINRETSILSTLC